MKIIEFGYSNDVNPKGSWEGIGIKEGLMLTEADYYGVVKYEDNSYLIAKKKMSMVVINIYLIILL